MTNQQFILLLKTAFFEYFFMRKAGKKPSLEFDRFSRTV